MLKYRAIFAKAMQAFRFLFGTNRDKQEYNQQQTASVPSVRKAQFKLRSGFTRNGKRLRTGKNRGFIHRRSYLVK